MTNSFHHEFDVCDWSPLGWWCSREWAHEGPCALHPRWWNVLGHLRSRR